MRLRSANPADAAPIQALLRESRLPTVGVRESIDGFVVAEEGTVLVGAIGVEGCGPQFGLLRSAVVSERWRGKGIGQVLVERAIDDARRRGMKALYLLTTTAEGYFPAFGFATTPRNAVPEPIRATAEFREACPDTATVMTLSLA